MAFFRVIIKLLIRMFRYKNICEIGASFGGNTDKLLSIKSVILTIIDPCIDTDLINKYKNTKRVRIYKGLSLQILPTIVGQFDCILIDGDHNWFTVFNELKVIEERKLLKDGGTIFLHDVGWPYGRRDMYYLPETIPDKYRHPYAKKGIVQGQTKLAEAAGINSHINNVEYEGGPKNGVLTAVEDYLKIYGKSYYFIYSKRQQGLGVLVYKKNISYFNKLVLKIWRFLEDSIPMIEKAPIRN